MNRKDKLKNIETANKRLLGEGLINEIKNPRYDLNNPEVASNFKNELKGANLIFRIRY